MLPFFVRIHGTLQALYDAEGEAVIVLVYRSAIARIRRHGDELKALVAYDDRIAKTKDLFERILIEDAGNGRTHADGAGLDALDVRRTATVLDDRERRDGNRGDRYRLIEPRFHGAVLERAGAARTRAGSKFAVGPPATDVGAIGAELGLKGAGDCIVVIVAINVLIVIGVLIVMTRSVALTCQNVHNRDTEEDEADGKDDSFSIHNKK